MVSGSMLTAAELEFLRTSSRVRGQYIRFAILDRLFQFIKMVALLCN